jgi:hypothetical protein
MYDYAVARLKTDRTTISDQIDRIEGDLKTHRANGNERSVDSLTSMLARLTDKRNSINAALELIPS